MSLIKHKYRKFSKFSFRLLLDLVSCFLKVQTPRPCKDVLRQAIRVNRIKKGQEMPVIDKSSTVPLKRRKVRNLRIAPLSSGTDLKGPTLN